MKSKNPSFSSNKIKIHQHFFILWFLFKKLYDLLNNYPINEHKLLAEALEKTGRLKYKKRGRLLLQSIKNAKTIADLLFRHHSYNPRMVSIPLYLLLILKEVINSNEFNHYQEVQKLVHQLHEIIVSLCEQHQIIIDITLRKFIRKRYRASNYIDDLKIEGYLSLHHAICNYEPTVQFNTYAYYWCFKYMMEYAKKYIFTNTIEYNDGILNKKTRGLYL